KIDCEFSVEDPWAADSRIPTLSPLGKVPVLQIGPEQYLFESAVVVHYLDELGGKPLPCGEGDAYWRSQWWQALGNGIIDAMVARVLETRRPADKQMPEKMQREEARIARALAAAEGACPDGAFLVGQQFSLADLVLGVAVQYIDIRYPHDWRRAHPRLKAWLGGIVARPSFESTLPPGFVKLA
ncbi:MAG: glutathione S-transferase family protein, partial [Burkholderiales bacterium]